MARSLTLSTTVLLCLSACSLVLRPDDGAHLADGDVSGDGAADVDAGDGHMLDAEPEADAEGDEPICPTTVDHLQRIQGIAHQELERQHTPPMSATAPFGVVYLRVRWTNGTPSDFSDVVLEMLELNDGEQLLNADCGDQLPPTFLSPGDLLGPERVLSAGESFTVELQIAIAEEYDHWHMHWSGSVWGLPVQ